MSNTIKPYDASRPDLQRAVQPSELENATDQIRSNEKIDKTEPGPKDAKNLDGLTSAEQQLIYRYFPESPSLELRLYKPDRSTNKVDPGSVGSRVDLRG